MSAAATLDMTTARRMMVDGQIRPNDVTSLEILGAMLAVPRELFVPPDAAGQAYLDSVIAIGEGRSLMKPMALAKLIQAAQVGAADHVLDLGCGTGYSSAVLARMAGSVVALEENAALARKAQEALAKAGAGSVIVATGPLTAGWPAAAPYDVIFLDGATEVVPEGLASQLKPDGRIVAVFRQGPVGKATVYRLSEGRLLGRPVFDASAPVLPGFVAPEAFVF